jgi:hypothetical protein
MRGYKVVQEISGNLVSFGQLPITLIVVYEPGRWARPPVGQLFVFRDLTDAEQAIRERIHRHPVEIWEAEGTNPRRIRTSVHLGWVDDKEPLIRHLWERGLTYEDEETSRDYHHPDCVILGCDQVKLVRRIKRVPACE